MLDLLASIIAATASMFRSRRSQALEILSLRQQLAIYERTAKRPVLRAHERVFWVRLSRLWTDWRSALVIVKPETVIAWHCKGFQHDSEMPHTAFRGQTPEEMYGGT